MTTAGGRAAANDATARVENLPEPPSTRRKAEAAVAYYERELGATQTGAANARTKAEKFGELARLAAEAVAAADAEVSAAETRLATARGQLAKMGG